MRSRSWRPIDTPHFSIHPEDGPALYHAVPFFQGIFEFQVNNLSQEFLQDVADYRSTRKQRPSPQTIPRMRTIPVGESIEPHLEAKEVLFLHLNEFELQSQGAPSGPSSRTIGRPLAYLWRDHSRRRRSLNHRRDLGSEAMVG
jgi:hypothetical protein